MITIRPATPEDSAALSALVVRTLWESNLGDYGPENIARVAGHFTPEAVAGMQERWQMFVAEEGAVLLGTASYFEASVRAVFVDPAAQGRGVGRALMEEVLRAAKAAGQGEINLRSSVMAEPFYQSFGFVSGEDLWNGTERTIAMRLTL